MANKFKGEITTDGKLIVELPQGIEPGTVEVIIRRPSNSGKKPRSSPRHPAFGIWAGRADITASAEFAAELRRRVETGQDGRE